MNNIEQQAIQTYQENLVYFEKYHKDLHKKLITLDTAISNGIYQEKYSLEYVKNSYFDILEISSNSYLYKKNSEDFTKELLSFVNYRRKGAVFEAQQRFDLHESELDEIEDFKNFHSSLWATAKIIHYNSKVAPKETSQMNILYKFIFLGTGLGMHIKEVISTYDIKVAFIYEKNLELFRLSLFTTNYAKSLKNRSAYFSVMQSFNELQSTFTSFLDEAFSYNLYIKFLPFATDYQEEIKNFQSIVLSQDYIAYPFQGYMAKSFSVIEKITNGYTFFDISSTYDDTIFSKKPVLILASGPSVQNNTQWIKENQDRFLIVAVLSVCNHLFHNKITPDIVVHIDPQEDATLSIIKDIDMSKFDNSTIIFGSSVHQKVIERFNRDDIIFIEQSSTYKVDFGFFSTPTIGEYAVIIPLLLGAKELYMIGLDLALDSETMKDHIDLHVASTILEHNHEEESVAFQGSICYVKGNFQEQVPSKPNFRFSISQFNDVLNIYKRNHQNIYNLSNGAYLNNTIPLNIKDINIDKFKILNKSKLQEKLNIFFTQNSSSDFRDIDEQYLQKQLNIAINIIDKVKELRRIKSKEPNNYLLKKLIPFTHDISEINIAKKLKSDMGTIFYEYFKITLSFVFDTFNTRYLRNVKKHVQEMDNMILDEIEKIARIYKEVVELYMKKAKDKNL